MKPDLTTEPRFDEPPSAQGHFAWLRTRMALERTIMAWVRTSTALIGFGFTIVQFFQRLDAMKSARPPMAPHTARYFGMSLIVAGVAAIVLATLQYLSVARYLRLGEFRVLVARPKAHVPSPLLGIAALLLLIGVGTLVAVWVRIP